MDPKRPGQRPEDETAAAVQIIDKARDLFVSDVLSRGDGTQFVLASDGLKLHELPALNPTLPQFVKQAEEIVEPESFIHYLRQYGSTRTICRASLGRNKIDAVLDYHGRSRQGAADDAVPGRSVHVATLLCPFDVDYAKWRPLLTGDSVLPQKQFIQFLQDLIYTVHAPPAADLIELTEDLSIDRVVRFRSATNDRNGNVRFTYDEQDEGGAPHNGEFKLPESIEIIVPIFQGGNPQRLNPRLRYRMKDGQLLLGLKLAGLETTEREAFRAIGENVRTDTSFDVFYVA
jgi:uncharacterized protein YfdQ (DUF2303 family)